MTKALLPVGLFTLAAISPLMAQNTGKAATQNAKTSNANLPPPAAGPESVKIDPAPEKPRLDTTAPPAGELTNAVRNMVRQVGSVSAATNMVRQLLAQQVDATTDEKTRSLLTQYAAVYQTGRVKGLMENMFIKIFSKYYTLEEVKQLSAFYETPLGRKTLMLTPTITEESMILGQQLGTMLASELIEAAR